MIINPKNVEEYNNLNANSTKGNMSDQNASRREFLENLTTIGVAGFSGSVLLSACTNRSGQGDKNKATEDQHAADVE